MPHNHDHNCSHEHDHNHEDHDSLSTGAQDSLYQYIDRANVVALNADDDYKGSDAIKPWHERASEDKVIVLEIFWCIFSNILLVCRVGCR